MPPSAKALNWFFSQHDKAGVFPLFFLSKEENPSYKTLALGKTRGVFGIGAAIYFKGYYSNTPMSYTLIKRYSMIFLFSMCICLPWMTTGTFYGFLFCLFVLLLPITLSKLLILILRLVEHLLLAWRVDCTELPIKRTSLWIVAKIWMN